MPRYFFFLLTMTRIYQEFPFLLIPLNLDPLKFSTLSPLKAFLWGVITISYYLLVVKRSTSLFLFFCTDTEKFFSTSISRTNSCSEHGERLSKLSSSVDLNSQQVFSLWESFWACYPKIALKQGICGSREVALSFISTSVS